MRKYKIALVDDHPIFVSGLRKLLEEEEDFEVVCVAYSYQEALRKIPEQEVDLVILDINLSGEDGIQVLRKLRKDNPDLPVLMLTVEESEEVIYRAVREGARGYILKHSSPERLLKSIRACLSGEVLLDSGVYMKVLEMMRKEDPEEERSLLFERLSPREIEIARLIAQGKSNREIAELLYISESTVKNHISNILRKLELKDRVDIATLVSRARLTESQEKRS
ncbi:response regulator transcription factor [Thermatribacter velox]|jgi:DNA-binding NarL/FixJ family response regulator|uniref:Response regulator transcription factor n=1 Tax=Thermatribacter velox TaxID=3039681 RepID=A0ABZ2YD68_9BACT